MKKLLLLVFVLFLSGCASVEPGQVARSFDGTAVAAQATAEFYRGEATRQALDVTRAAEALSATQTAEAIRATQRSQASVSTATAAYRSTQDGLAVVQTQAAMTATATAQAQAAARADLDIRRQAAVNIAMGWLPLIVVLTLMGMLAFGAAGFIRAEVARRRVLLDSHGDPSLGLTTGGGYIQFDRMVLPFISPSRPVETSLAAQLSVTENAQKIALARALPHIERQPAQPQSVQSGPVELPIIGRPNELPAMVDTWQVMQRWEQPGFLLGIGEEGPLSIDPEQSPHLLVAGTSGAGKTRQGLRIVAAGALALGWQVVLLNGAGPHFNPLRSHPNLLIKSGDGETIAGVLERIAGEVDRRDQVLTDNNISTWSRMPAGAQPPLMVIIDELVALTWSLRGSVADRVWRAVIHITSRGRSSGISLVAATTDPTYRTLGRPGLVMRDNCARMLFRVRDVNISRAALDAPGAESLPKGQFLAALGGSIKKATAFDPSDEQISAYIKAHRADVFPQPDWLYLPEEQKADEAVDNQIIELAGQGLSMNEIQRRVFGFSGGAFYNRVKKVLDANTTTNTSGESGPVLVKQGSSIDA